MTSSQEKGTKTGQTPNASQYGKRSLQAIHAALELMTRARSVTDPIRMFEAIFEGDLATLSKESPTAERILNMILGMLEGAKKSALENYILTYLPYDMENHTLKFSAKRTTRAQENQSIVISLTDFFSVFQRSSLTLGAIREIAASSPKIRRSLLLGFFPSEFDEMDYHHYGSDGDRKKRRKALLSIMEYKVTRHDSWLAGAPKSPERAIAMAMVINERIKKAKKQNFSFKEAMLAWREDIAYLKYNYFDSVLHLNGLRWPSIGA